MAKTGTYHVRDPEGQPTTNNEDTSYKSFLCAILIFLVFCLAIILFSSVDWFKRKEREPLESNGNTELLSRYEQEKGKEKPHAGFTDKPPDTDKENKEKEQSEAPPVVTDKELPKISSSQKPLTTPKEKDVKENDLTTAKEFHSTPPFQKTTSSAGKHTESKIISGKYTTEQPIIETSTIIDDDKNKDKITNIDENISTHRSIVTESTNEYDETSGVTETIIDRIQAQTQVTIFTEKDKSSSKSGNIETTTELMQKYSTENLITTENLADKITTISSNEILPTDKDIESSSISESIETTTESMQKISTDNLIMMLEEDTDNTTTTENVRSSNKLVPTEENIQKISTLTSSLHESTSTTSFSDEDVSNESIKEVIFDYDDDTNQTVDSATSTSNRVSFSVSQSIITNTSSSPMPSTPLIISRRVNPSKAKAITTTEKRLKNEFKMVVSNMLGMMDHRTDMCEDFYWYSCGNYKEFSRRNDAFDEVFRTELNIPTKAFTHKMSTFYKTCIEHETIFDYDARINEVKEIANKFLKAQPTREDLTILIAEMVLTNSFLLMDIDVGVHRKTQQYVFKLSPPFRSLTRNEVERFSALYASDSNCARQLLREHRFEGAYLNLDQIYKDYINCTRDFHNYLIAFNITKNSFDFLSKVRKLDFFVENEILDLIKHVKSSSVRDTGLSDIYDEQTLDEIQAKYDVINWKLLFKQLCGQNLDGTSKIFVYDSNLVRDILIELKRAGEAYIGLLAVYVNDMFYNNVIPNSADTRDRYCTNLCNYLFSDASSYLYMSSLTSKQIDKSKQMANKIFKTLQSTLVSNIDAVNIDEPDKSEIISRVNTLSTYFMEKPSEKHLETIYQPINLGQSYISQVIEMRKHKSRRKYSLIGRVFNDDDIFSYFVQPQDIKPKSFYFSSKIAIPYELVLPWSMDYPGYFLMAKIGTNIAVEMGKLFNKVGLSYVIDATDLLEELQLDISQEFYIVEEKNVSMIISEAKYIQTVGDNAGFTLSHSIYNETQTKNKGLPWVEPHFSQESLFYVAAAQEFCEDANPVDYMLRLYEGKTFPNYWRLNNMIINSKDFSKTFSCKSGSNMNPAGANHLAFPKISADDDYN